MLYTKQQQGLCSVKKSISFWKNQMLSASENRFKEVEITGLLEDAKTLEITAVKPVG